MFMLYLPRVETLPPVAMIEESQTLVDGHGIRVLVVEDNADVGAFAAQSLSDSGCTTVIAANVFPALADLARATGRFDVVFSDVMMPGMTGVELGQKIRRQYRDCQ